jgi:hypothetical protein
LALGHIDRDAVLLFGDGDSDFFNLLCDGDDDIGH